MAENLLDEFLIKVRLDSDELGNQAQGIEKDLDKTGKSAKHTGKNINNAAKEAAAFRREILGAFAVITGGRAIISFTGDIGRATQALGNLSKALNIDPQKLTQLHGMAEATGGMASDIDGMLSSIQARSSTNEGRTELTRLGSLLGVNALDDKGNVRSDIFDQLNASKVFQEMPRAVQENYISQFGGDTAITNLVTNKNFSKLEEERRGLGPTRDQIRKSNELMDDWSLLKSETDQIKRIMFESFEPSVHVFLRGLIAIEKAHPKAIGEGLAVIGGALTVLSGILAVKSWLRVLKFLGGDFLKGAAVRGAAAYGAEFAAAEAAGSVAPGAGNVAAGLAVGADVVDDVAFDGKGKKIGWQWLKKGLSKLGDIAAGASSSFSPISPAGEILEQQSPQSLDINRLTGAVAMQESKGDARAVSDSGALGLMQLEPGTAKEYGVRDPFNSEQSWRGGQAYLRHLLNQYNDTAKALAAYNWGPRNLRDDIKANGDNWREHLPKETREYLRKVYNNYNTSNVIHGYGDVTNSTSQAVQHVNHYITTKESIKAAQALPINNTTHNNNQKIEVNVVTNTDASPHDIAHAVHQNIARSLVATDTRKLR